MGSPTAEFFAATGNPMGSRVVPTIAVKKQLNTMVIDARRAFLQVMEEGDVFVHPPKDWCLEADYRPGCIWKARTVWYGERGASQEWQEFFSEHLLAMGFVRGIRDPTKFVHFEHRLYLETHADDGHCAGDDKDLIWMYDGLVERGVKLKPRTIFHVGDQYRYLRRRYRREPESMYFSPSRAYVDDTIADLGFDESTKSSPTPGTSKDLIRDGTGGDPVSLEEKQIYGTCVMRMLFASLDGRWEVAYVVKQLSRHLSAPTKEHFARLKKLGRFLVGHRDVEVLIPVKGDMDTIYADTDTDWASDPETRKSTSCGLLGGRCSPRAVCPRSGHSCDLIGASGIPWSRLCCE